MTTITVPPVRVFFDESLRIKILAGIDDCLRQGQVAGGKKVREFEEFWADYTGCAHAVATSSGGSSLEVLMRVLDVGGKDVLVPTNTFIATANAVTFAGGQPVLIDAEPKTMSVSLAEIKKRRMPKTAGVIVVHIGGIINPEIEAIAEWCRTNKLWLVEDAAHAHGSELNGKRPGVFGVAAAYSFFATKVITSGEGGMIVCNDAGLAEACRCFRDYGKKTQWESFHTVISGNSRMSDLSAVVGLEHARHLDRFIMDRESVAKRYTCDLRGSLEPILPQNRSSWYKYIAYLPKGINREPFKKALKDRGISLSGCVYDVPLHKQPVFKGRVDQSAFPVASDVCERHICLPIFSGMTEEQILYVIDAIKTVTSDFLESSTVND